MYEVLESMDADGNPKRGRRILELSVDTLRDWIASNRHVATASDLPKDFRVEGVEMGFDALMASVFKREGRIQIVVSSEQWAPSAAA